MNTATAIVIFIAMLAAVECHPAFRKKLDNMINENPCLKQCMQIVKDADLELSVVKTVDYANYFLRLDQICSIIGKARECIDSCGIASNPFKLNSMTVMCSDVVRKETKKFEKCMKSEGQKVMGICESKCGVMKAVSDEIEKKTALLNSNSNSPNAQKLFGEVMEKTNHACGLMKCIARCSRETFSKVCADEVDSDAGEFMYNFVERINQAMLLDLEQQQVRETMMRSMPVHCNYMHTPQMMFNSTADEMYLREFERQLAANAQNQQQPVYNSVMSELAELQKTVLIKELNVLEKRERLIEKESRKLDMEMSVMNGRGSF